MKFFTAVCLAIVLSLQLVSAQYFNRHFGGSFGGGFGGLNAFSGDFGGNSGFGGGSLGQVNVRDPRQDRGPVVFPPSPANGPVESSGVIVGASGFGFVPPQQSYPSIYQNYRNYRYF